MKCNLCNRETLTNTSRFCRYHEESYIKLKSGYIKWQYAYGKLDWFIYLEKVEKRSETGIWVKECCVFLKKDKENFLN